MHIEGNRLELRLDAGKGVRVWNAVNATVQCKNGLIWLTQLGDIEDYLLSPGGEFVLRKSDVLLYPIKQSDIFLAAIPSSVANKKGLARIGATIRDAIRKATKGLLAWIRVTYGPAAIEKSRRGGWWGF